MEIGKQICKLLKDILSNPKDISFEKIDRLFKGFGYRVGQPRKGGSHYIYRKKGDMPITVPYRKPVKKYYIKHIIKILELEGYYEKNCKKRY